MTKRNARNNLPRRTPDRKRAILPRLHNAAAHAVRPLRAHPRWSTATAAALAGLAATAAILLPDHGQPASIDPRTRLFANYRACLLTGPDGTSTQPAQAAWTGMQQAANTTNERVTTQPVTGAQTTVNATIYLNTLAMQGCGIIITAGTIPNQAARTDATAFPHTKFLAINPDTNASTKPGNFTAIIATDPGTISTSIDHALLDDFQSHTTASPGH